MAQSASRDLHSDIQFSLRASESAKYACVPRHSILVRASMSLVDKTHCQLLPTSLQASLRTWALATGIQDH